MGKKIVLPKSDVIVTLACLFVLLMTVGAVTNRGRCRAKALVCMTNEKLLLEGWLGFAADNDGMLVGGNTYNDSFSEVEDWVDQPQDEDGVIQIYEPELEYELIGISRGALYPYIEDFNVYNCPSDIGRYLFGCGYRTYAITGPMHGEVFYEDDEYPYYARTIFEIARPSEKFVFVECIDSRGWNMGSWIMEPEALYWIDPIAIWHPFSTTLGFADGHSEVHQWQEESTIWMAENQVFYFYPPSDEMSDILYMASGYVPGL